MLRCPKCNRTYQDDMQKFCTHDGGRLVPDIEKPKSFDPNATVTTDGSAFDVPVDSPPMPLESITSVRRWPLRRLRPRPQEFVRPRQLRQPFRKPLEWTSSRLMNQRFTLLSLNRHNQNRPTAHLCRLRTCKATRLSHQLL